MTAFVLATRELVPANLFAVGAELTLACAIYGVVFVFFGLTGPQRRMYLTKVVELMQHRHSATGPVVEGA